MKPQSIFFVSSTCVQYCKKCLQFCLCNCPFFLKTRKVFNSVQICIYFKICLTINNRNALIRFLCIMFLLVCAVDPCTSLKALWIGYLPATPSFLILFQIVPSEAISVCWSSSLLLPSSSEVDENWMHRLVLFFGIFLQSLSFDWFIYYSSEISSLLLLIIALLSLLSCESICLSKNSPSLSYSSLYISEYSKEYAGCVF